MKSLVVMRSSIQRILLQHFRNASRNKEGTDFPTQEALEDYLKSHPKADKSKHRVMRQETKGKHLAPVDVESHAKGVAVLRTSHPEVASKLEKFLNSREYGHQELQRSSEMELDKVLGKTSPQEFKDFKSKMSPKDKGQVRKTVDKVLEERKNYLNQSLEDAKENPQDWNVEGLKKSLSTLGASKESLTELVSAMMMKQKKK